MRVWVALSIRSLWSRSRFNEAPAVRWGFSYAGSGYSFFVWLPTNAAKGLRLFLVSAMLEISSKGLERKGVPKCQIQSSQV